MKKIIVSIIFLLILYFCIYGLVIFIEFTYANLNKILALITHFVAITLMIYIIDKIVKKIDKK